MADERRFADVDSMRLVVRAAFGKSRSLLKREWFRRLAELPMQL